MMPAKFYHLLALAVLAVSSAMAAAEPMPALRDTGSTKQLIVDGKPWISLAGEVHNSTASSSTYMAPVWARLSGLNLNTVVMPTYWELIEPQEGRFDFTLVDSQLAEARKHNLRIVLLWFGTMKNASSNYAPEWVLADRARFPRASAPKPTIIPFAKFEPRVSVFNERVMRADARAFAALMAHLAKVDPQHTVIAVQVENETGLLGDSRDRSPDAERAWNSQVPAALMSYLTRKRGKLERRMDELWKRNGYKQAGTWPEVFGTDWQADELFMAWGVSHFVNTVAAAGKKQLALPMYANAWLGPQRPTDKAGDYPAGGPVPRVFDVWRAGAPSLDWLSPDIYVDDFASWANAYTRRDNPLFIPEAKLIVGNLFIALGQHRAIGFSPFGIEDALPGNQLSEAYGLLKGMGSLLGEAQASGSLTGFALEKGASHKVTLGDYVVTVRGQQDTVSKMLLDMGVTLPTGGPDRKPQNVGEMASELTDIRPMGMVIQLNRDEFLVIGKNLYLTFASKRSPDTQAEVSRIEEGTYRDGQWLAGRILNGDERLRIVPNHEFGMARIKVTRSPG
jgi:hypothetical protein